MIPCFISVKKDKYFLHSDYFDCCHVVFVRFFDCSHFFDVVYALLIRWLICSVVEFRLLLVFSLFGCCMFFVCMLSQSDHFFPIPCSLLLLPDIYVSVTNLVRCKIYMVGFRMFYFPVCSRIFPLSVSVLLLSSVFLSKRWVLPGSYSFYSTFRMCSVWLVRLFSSDPLFFYFFILPRSFLSVIAVIYLEISNSSAEMVLKLYSVSISISRLQNSSGVSSSDCFAQNKSPRLW